jgi:hypothetical protein
MASSENRYQDSSAPYDEIIDALNVYHEHGNIIELRIPNKDGAIGGLYDDFETLAKDARLYSEKKEYNGIFITINKINSAMNDQVANSTKNDYHRTTDEDISQIRFLPIDLDPIRKSKTSSNEEEHNAAYEKAVDIMNELNWPLNALIGTDSGNGVHLLYRVQLENDPSNVALIKQCLEALDYLFSDDVIKVDTQTSNPSTYVFG